MQNLSVDFSGYGISFNQHDIKCCAESALCAGLVILMRMNGIPVFTPSVLFMYYTTRQLQNTEHMDWGSYLPALVASLRMYGLCPDELWPFAQDRILAQPDPICYEVAQKCNLMVDFDDIDPTINSVNYALASRQLVLSVIRTPIEDRVYHMILLIGIDFNNQQIIYIDSEYDSLQSMPFAEFTEIIIHTSSISIRPLFNEMPKGAIMSDACCVIDSGLSFDAVVHDEPLRPSDTSYRILWVDPRDARDPRDFPCLIDLLAMPDTAGGIIRVCSTQVVMKQDNVVLLQVSSSTGGDTVLVRTNE